MTLDHKNNSIPRWISLIHRYGRIYIGERLEHLGIGKGQMPFLNTLYKEDGLSQEELANYLKIDKGTTAKALKKLEELGYISRQPRDDDKRYYRVYLTEKGLQIKDEVRHVLTNWRNILSDGFTGEEKQMALTILEKMGDNAARCMEEGLKENRYQPND